MGKAEVPRSFNWQVRMTPKRCHMNKTAQDICMKSAVCVLLSLVGRERL
jgi:hypothetical protein